MVSSSLGSNFFSPTSYCTSLLLSPLACPSMSERSISTRRKIRNHRQRTTKHQDPISRWIHKAHVLRRLKTPKPIKTGLQRCHSEPILWTIGVVFDEKDEGSRFDGVLFSPQSCVDIFVPPSVSPFASNLERYNKDAKVVLNVTVEGSPGPVKTLVKLGASVEDTIRHIVDKYCEERRSPHLGRDGMSSFELHHSHFSLDSIDKKDRIGDVGTRSFYLRKNCSSQCRNQDGILQPISLTSATDHISPTISAFVFTPAFFARKMSKFGRSARKLWKVLSCSP